MKKIILTLLVIFCLTQVSFAQEKRVLTLEEVVQLARSNSLSAKLAETQRNLNFWSYNVYKSRLKPQLLLRGTLPNFVDRARPITQNDGSVNFIPINQNNSNLSLGLEQILPRTNTTIALESNIARFDNFVEGQEQTSYQGDPFGLTITQPLFAVNPFKWDRQIEPLRYEQSKRAYVQGLENTSKDAARLFFQLLIVQKDLEIGLQNEASNDTINKIEQGRYNIGTTTEDALLNTELNLITAQSNAQQARLDLQSRSLELRNFIGITDDVELELVPPAEVPDFLIDYETALQYAKDNRAEFLGFKLDQLNADQGIADARATRFSADLRATFGFNSAQTSGISDVYNGTNLATGSTIRLDFRVPILDGGRNRSRMNVAIETKKLTEFRIEQEQSNFEQEIATAVRNFEQILSQITIAEKRQEIALRGFEITNGRYLAGKVGILDLNNSRETKDSAIRGYISALQQYWDAYYQLRNLTLYDFRSKQLLYNPLLEYDPKTDSVIEMEQKK